MPYDVAFSNTAERSLGKLDRSILARIKPRVLALADDPRPPGCTKLAGHATLWRIRVGDYRVVYDVDDAAERVEVTIVAHRRESYRGL
ncbi:MAG TPA: type II toxin-antitoxin system RelE/ParE family toxin [Tepidisphaeraceae bacterium]|jgi:mRNA interferase RelE/StbE|nr:type II toxin-antitoxin system RelE/ParE family toxin [Tepidisphaeraceae bacterium]